MIEMESLLSLAIEQIEIEMEAMGKIDDSDYADRFLDKLADELATDEVDVQDLLEAIKEHMSDNYKQYGECNEEGNFIGGYTFKEEK